MIGTPSISDLFNSHAMASWAGVTPLDLATSINANRYHGAIAPVPLTHVGYAEKLQGRLIRELGIDRESLVVSTKVAGEMLRGI